MRLRRLSVLCSLLILILCIATLKIEGLADAVEEEFLESAFDEAVVQLDHVGEDNSAFLDIECDTLSSVVNVFDIDQDESALLGVQEVIIDASDEMIEKPFVEGYVHISKGTILYLNKNGHELGHILDDSVVYAVTEQDEYGADSEWLWIVFDTEESMVNNEDFLTAYVRSNVVTVLSDVETVNLTGNDLLRKYQDYIPLPIVTCEVADKEVKNETIEQDVICSESFLLQSSSITIINQPEDVYAEIGERVYITTEAEGEGLSYQWYIRDLGYSRFAKSSMTTSTYEVKVTENRYGRELYCVVSDAQGHSVKTNTVSILRKEENERSAARITFIDDDGRKAAAESWERIAARAGIPVTMALITNEIGKAPCMSWEDVSRLQSMYGFEFVSHTHNHIVLPKTDSETIQADFQLSKEVLSMHGCNADVLVFPQNASDERTLSIVKDYFAASFRGGNMVNVSPLNLYQITRVNLLNKERYPLTLSAMKAWVDSAVDKGGWLVFMGHNYYANVNKAAEDDIVRLCEYAKSKGVEIVNVSEGLRTFYQN